MQLYEVAVIQVIILYAFSPLTPALSHPLGGEGEYCIFLKAFWYKVVHAKR